MGLKSNFLFSSYLGEILNKQNWINTYLPLNLVLSISDINGGILLSGHPDVIRHNMGLSHPFSCSKMNKPEMWS